MHVRAAFLIAVLTVSQVAAQDRSVFLKAPYGDANPLISPDGVFALSGSDPASYQLWLEDRRTHERKMVLRATLQTLTLAWSPDSAAFAIASAGTAEFRSCHNACVGLRQTGVPGWKRNRAA
jgi:Tol biopolymer transport system component